MAPVARKAKDQRLLKLIRRDLESGIMQQGLVEPRADPGAMQRFRKMVE